MIKKIFNLFESESITNPKVVDSFIVSAFIELNNISVANNKFIAGYLIDESNTNYSQYCSFLTTIKENITSFTLEHLIQMFEFVISLQIEL